MLNFLQNTKETFELFQTKRIMIFLGTTHYIFAFFMLYNDIPYSFLINIIIASFYFFSLVYVKMNDFNKCIFTIFSSITIHAFFSLWFFGYGYGYECLLLPMISYCYMGVYKTKYRAYFIALFGFLMYVLMLYFFVFQDYSMHYDLQIGSYDARFLLSLFHGVSICVVFVIISSAIRKQRSKNIEERKSLNKILQENTGIDALTNLYTRWYFLETMYNVSDFHKTSFIIIDIDDFKNINKTYGYETGDEILIECGNYIKKHFKQHTDLFCRWGAEEFLLIINNKTEQEFMKICETFLNDFKDSILASLNINLNMSIGMLYIEKNFRINLFDEYVIRAEYCLNRAKTYSREKIVKDYM